MFNVYCLRNFLGQASLLSAWYALQSAFVFLVKTVSPFCFLDGPLMAGTMNGSITFLCSFMLLMPVDQLLPFKSPLVSLLYSNK